MKEKLLSIGFLSEEADFLQKVQKCLTEYSKAKYDRSNVLAVLKESGQFTSEELELLEKALQDQPTEDVLKNITNRIKEILKKFI